MRIYFDNAATTPLDKEVLEVMLPYLTDFHGNPSSIHTHGREVRSAIEKSRKTVAALLNTSPSEIFFTSGGTEADNTAIHSCIATHRLTHAITSRLEHHAVLHTLEDLANRKFIGLSYVKTDEKGHIDLNDLEKLLQENPHSFVSLMHANNEIGNMIDLALVGELCKKHHAFFHSDTVQTVGHFKHDLQQTKVDFIVGAAHKFHGPKGVGFLYINADTKIHPFIHGGSQERNMRGGTENVYGIVGLAKALEIADRNFEEEKKYILGLKTLMMEKLIASIEDIRFNGDCNNSEKSLYTVLNISLPPATFGDMLLFNLDIEKISASGGSACSSGSEVGSHVLHALHLYPERSNVRFSFSKYIKPEEVDYVVEVLKKMYAKEK
ncbi:MAG: cysteine desulfurase, partial [Verrucomicrobia bacterium]|nr:cysteine desulfurase [Cytophagales bacterium]